MASERLCRRYEKQVVVVTAATAGIGMSIARRFSQEGAYVLISSRRKKNILKALDVLRNKEGLDNIYGTECHVGKEVDREALLNSSMLVSNIAKGLTTINGEISKNGYIENFSVDPQQRKSNFIDVVVSNAAISPFLGQSIDTPELAWEKLFDTNVKSSFFLIKTFAEYICQNGSILLVASVLGFNPTLPIGAYGVSKTALIGLTKMLSNDLAVPPKSIRVNCIAPGVVKTEFSRALWLNGYEVTQSSGTLPTIPLARFASPDEISGAAAFLCSHKDASYITGETLVIAGGMQSRL